MDLTPCTWGISEIPLESKGLTCNPSRLTRDYQDSALIHLRSQSHRNRALGHQLIPCWDRSRGSCQTCFSATEAQCFGHHKIDPKRIWLKLLSWKHSIDWIALPNPVCSHKQHLLDNLQHLTQHLLDNGSSHCQNKTYPNYSYFLSTHQESQDYLFCDTTYLL